MRAAEATRPETALDRARQFRQAGMTLEAAAELQAAIAADPEWGEAYHQLGNILKSLGRYGEAENLLREAVRLEPGNAAALLNLGVVLVESDRPALAEEAFRRALEFEPNRPEARNILGHALLAQGRCSEAIEELERALRLKPGYPAAHDNLGRALKAQGRADEALAHHRAALAARPNPSIHSNLLYTLNLVDGADPAEIAAEHFRWAELHAAPFAGREPPPGRAGAGAMPAPRAARRIRVGYVSADFVQHAVAFYFLPLLASHDLKRFEVFCYSNSLASDAVTRRIHGLTEHWRDIARLNDDAAATLIRRDGIDLLVDLAGHTARNRLGVFARRAAPVQVTWLGYPNTTGLRQMDFRLTDAVADPDGEADARHSERLVRLPASFVCYEPPENAPEPGRLPAAHGGGVTFGCFNNLAKVGPATVRLWAALLHTVPRSRLMLKSRGLADPRTAEWVRARFGREGITGDRIACDGESRPVAGHLALYRRIDIALDAFPYNGTTTTCEALLMGVPVVTLAGTVHASRVGASLLTALGRPEWVAESREAYVEIARDLAGDLDRLASIRASLRERLLASPLCDRIGFARRIETAFAAMLGG